VLVLLKCSTLHLKTKQLTDPGKDVSERRAGKAKFKFQPAEMASRKKQTLSEEQKMLVERQQKVEQFEAFINDRLKVDLDHILTLRDQVYAELAQ